VLYLQPLAFLLGQTLVVGELLHQQPDLLAKLFLRFLGRSLSILYCVVQEGRLETRQVRHSADAGQNLSATAMG